MRHDFRDGVDRKVKSATDWTRPEVVDVPITRQQIGDIVSAQNPKGALRDFYRRWKASR